MNSFHSVIYKSFSALFSFSKVLTAEWTRWCFWSDNRWPGHLCLTRNKSKAFSNGLMDITGHWHCGGMFIFCNRLRAQIHHSCLLVKVIGKADIMLEMNKYPLMPYCCSVIFLRLLDECWSLCRPDRHIRTDCWDDFAMRHSVSNIWGSKKENCKGEWRLPLRYCSGRSTAWWLTQLDENAFT